MTFLATDAGYKVHCNRIPPNSSLMIVMAIVEMKKSLQTVKPGPIVIPNGAILSPDKVSEQITVSGKDGSHTYWCGTQTNVGLYLPKPKPRNVSASGYYSASSRRRGLTKDVNLSWGENDGR
jgi:hypothetical protein